MDLELRVLPQDAQAAVSIQYTTEYADTFGLLYAAMAAGEKSPRVLRLTRQCIDLGNAHYTAWDYRFQVRHLAAAALNSRCAPLTVPYRSRCLYQ